jgi:GNAT superfamily N-acetyltransferase
VTKPTANLAFCQVVMPAISAYCPPHEEIVMSDVTFVAGDADAGLRDRLEEEITAFNAAATGIHDERLLSIAVRGNNDDLRAGLYGWTWGGCGFIDMLWVRDDQRGSGLGPRLLATAGAEIRRRGCERVALSTHSFQAPEFYARFGYTECGRTPGYPHGHDEIHLVKELS